MPGDLEFSLWSLEFQGLLSLLGAGTKMLLLTEWNPQVMQWSPNISVLEPWSPAYFGP